MSTTYTDGTNEVIAEIWNKNGDHSEDNSQWLTDSDNGTNFKSEGSIVRYFRHPRYNGLNLCGRCNQVYDKHGWLEKEDKRVCPGMFVLTVLTNPVRYDAISEEEFYSKYRAKDMVRKPIKSKPNYNTGSYIPRD